MEKIAAAGIALILTAFIGLVVLSGVAIYEDWQRLTTQLHHPDWPVIQDAPERKETVVVPTETSSPDIKLSSTTTTLDDVCGWRFEKISQRKSVFNSEIYYMWDLVDKEDWPVWAPVWFNHEPNDAEIIEAMKVSCKNKRYSDAEKEKNALGEKLRAERINNLLGNGEIKS
jgi:hypothetical protein